MKTYLVFTKDSCGDFYYSNEIYFISPKTYIKEICDNYKIFDDYEEMIDDIDTNDYNTKYYFLKSDKNMFSIIKKILHNIMNIKIKVNVTM